MTEAIFLRPEQRIVVDEWQGCYDDGWRGRIVESAFQHPAKGAYGLAQRIYKHAAEEEWIVPGSTVIDPFGGIAGFAFHAMKHGCHWIGCELEPRFAELGNMNLALWNRRFSTLPGWGSAVLLQGDSRKLCEIIQGQVECCVSSPPYVDQSVAKNSASINREKQFQSYQQSGSWQSFAQFCATQDKHSGDYGQTPGNLASLPAGRFDVLASSPPYEAGCSHTGGNDPKPEHVQGGTIYHVEYGRTDGQLGQAATDDFWSAARAIIEQCHQLLKPGAVSIWVAKGFVRKGKLVDFPHQWQALCESVGFVTLHEHHAMLTTELDEQFHLNGSSEKRVVSRKSFFRRLCESKGSPKIDYETVLCMKKPYPRCL